MESTVPTADRDIIVRLRAVTDDDEHTIEAARVEIAGLRAENAELRRQLRDML